MPTISVSPFSSPSNHEATICTASNAALSSRKRLPWWIQAVMKLWRVIWPHHHGKNSAAPQQDVEKHRSPSPTPSVDSGQQSGLGSRCQSREQLLGTTVVELVKTEDSTLGIIISGGVDKGLCPSISSLRPGSVAQRCDALCAGDRVTAVNGISTTRLKHDEIVSLLRGVEDRAVLELEYPLPSFPSENSVCVCPKITHVTIEREAGSLGFTLRGGAHPDPLLSRPLVITYVRPGGPADSEGSLKSGDRLVAVDGQSLHCATLTDAQTVLHQSDSKFTVLTIEYDVSVLESVRQATGPLLVEIERPPVKDLGVTLASATSRQEGEASTAVVIESIKPASIAERCGALHVGDQILAVDETRVDGVTTTAADVMQLLRNVNSAHITLEILPLSQLNCGWRLSENSVRSRGFLGPKCNTGGLHSPSPSPSGFSTLNSRHHRSRQYSHPHHPRLNRLGKADSNSTSCHDTASLPGSYSGGVLCHTETLHVTLQPDLHGYGLSVVNPDSSSPAVVISSIDPGGPADRCGCLQVGDRILAVNHKSVVLDSLNADEVTQIFLCAEGSNRGALLTLHVEFDVADAVVPSSGIFSVKLARRGSGLGITITASKSCLPGEPLLISDIRRGSVAHRTGTLQPGDKLLAIDSLRLDQCSLEDTQQILQGSSDIVTLRIQKGDAFPDVPDTHSIVYTVELARHGGPLGITIAGSEEPFEPITISGLTQGGLAEQTGALHVGDRLLAINGESLRGKPLSEAIGLLQSSGDTVTLKIARTIARTHCEDAVLSVGQFGPALPSVDSAVESWDSSVLEQSPPSNNTSPDSNQPPQQHLTVAEVYKSESATVKRKQKVGPGGDAQLSPGGKMWDASHSSHSLDSEQSGGTSEGDIVQQWDKSPGANHEAQTTKQFLGAGTMRTGESLLPFADMFSSSSIPSVGHKPPIGLPAHKDVCFPADSPPHSPLPLPHYLHGNTLPHRRRYVGSDNPASLGMSYLDETGSNVYMNADNAGSSAVYSCGSYTHLPSGSPQLDLYQVTLFKDPVYEDFGFSVSDGLYERGVYINRVRKGGPADMSTVLQPYDRILQVNETRTHDFDCCLTVPLIASAGEKLELTVARNSGCSSENKVFNGVLTWAEEVIGSVQCPVPDNHTSGTITKTL
ncbi:glutamate receptor-interacting protein 2 isoform X2 [Cryptotermes secundus]|uniref:glutamate receptor-interacting protein 2 isoform X2 n=1 Tax=Cryptotermes secundus TaxID=105785 RepID=UPI000CD7C84F|nr:glutamate receptor-interacting protein 2 isoform X2 [Cryptotermes secundus]